MYIGCLLVGRLPLYGATVQREGGEGVVSLFEEAGDCVSIHAGWLLQRITHKLGEYVSWQEEPDGCCRGLQ
jgi:hypothetical protein